MKTFKNANLHHIITDDDSMKYMSSYGFYNNTNKTEEN